MEDARKEEKKGATRARQKSGIVFMMLQEVIRRLAGHVRLTTTRGRVKRQAVQGEGQDEHEDTCERDETMTYKVYLRCSSNSMMAAWLPQR